MTNLKLAKLPDRTPVKLTLSVSPELNRALIQYAEVYREAYNEAEVEPITEIIPYMLQSFLEGDRSFAKARKNRTLVEKTNPPVAANISLQGRRATPGSSTTTS
jgi:hypothetical protein